MTFLKSSEMCKDFGSMKIENMDPKTYFKLVQILDSEDTWRKLGEYLGYNETEIQKFAKLQSRGKLLTTDKVRHYQRGM